MPDKIECPVPGHTGEWIQVRERVSVGEWNRWKVADAEETQALACRLVAAWSLTDAQGEPAPAPTTGVTALEVLDLTMLGWLIKAITDTLVERMQYHPQT